MVQERHVCADQLRYRRGEAPHHRREWRRLHVRDTEPPLTRSRILHTLGCSRALSTRLSFRSARTDVATDTLIEQVIVRPRPGQLLGHGMEIAFARGAEAGDRLI